MRASKTFNIIKVLAFFYYHFQVILVTRETDALCACENRPCFLFFSFALCWGHVIWRVRVNAAVRVSLVVHGLEAVSPELNR